MLHVPDLDQKLDTLMSLARDDRDGPPPRLRHARRSGCARAAQHPAPALERPGRPGCSAC